VTGSLLTHLTEAVVNHLSFEQIHTHLLENFITSRRRAQLRFERLQVDNELLSTYIHYVREAALILCIQECEAQVVARFIEGLTQAQRVHFVFEAHPTSFADLERLVMLDHNLARAEQFKEQASCVKRDAVKFSGRHNHLRNQFHLLPLFVFLVAGRDI
jgi:ribosomal protein S6